MATNNESTITEEVERRLDDIFREDDEMPSDLTTEAGNAKGSPHGEMGEVLPDLQKKRAKVEELSSGVLSGEEFPGLGDDIGAVAEPPPIELGEELAGLKIDTDEVEAPPPIELSEILLDLEEENSGDAGVISDELSQKLSGLEEVKGEVEEISSIELGEEFVGLKIDTDEVEAPPPIELSEILPDLEEENSGDAGVISDELSQQLSGPEEVTDEVEEISSIELMDKSAELKTGTDYINSSNLIELEKVPPEPGLEMSGVEKFPLEELRAIILSIDWEINDEIMTKLVEEVDGLKKIYGDDKILRIFFQILGSIGKYMKVNGANAHPNTIQVMNSLFLALEKVILSEDISEIERKKILLEEATKFKKLKDEISHKRTDADRESKQEVQREAKQVATQEEKQTVYREEKLPVKGVAPHEAFAFALEEIREVIKAEFRTLKAELKLWREEG